MTFLTSFVCVHPHMNVCVHHAERPIQRCEREKNRETETKTKNAMKMEMLYFTVLKSYLLKSAIFPNQLDTGTI